MSVSLCACIMLVLPSCSRTVAFTVREHPTFKHMFQHSPVKNLIFNPILNISYLDYSREMDILDDMYALYYSDLRVLAQIPMQQVNVTWEHTNFSHRSL